MICQMMDFVIVATSCYGKLDTVASLLYRTGSSLLQQQPAPSIPLTLTNTDETDTPTDPAPAPHACILRAGKHRILLLSRSLVQNILGTPPQRPCSYFRTDAKEKPLCLQLL